MPLHLIGVINADSAQDIESIDVWTTPDPEARHTPSDHDDSDESMGDASSDDVYKQVKHLLFTLTD